MSEGAWGKGARGRLETHVDQSPGVGREGHGHHEAKHRHGSFCQCCLPLLLTSTSDCSCGSVLTREGQSRLADSDPA